MVVSCNICSCPEFTGEQLQCTHCPGLVTSLTVAAVLYKTALCTENALGFAYLILKPISNSALNFSLSVRILFSYWCTMLALLQQYSNSSSSSTEAAAAIKMQLAGLKENDQFQQQFDPRRMMLGSASASAAERLFYAHHPHFAAAAAMHHSSNASPSHYMRRGSTDTDEETREDDIMMLPAVGARRESRRLYHVTPTDDREVSDSHSSLDGVSDDDGSDDVIRAEANDVISYEQHVTKHSHLLPKSE